MGCALQKVLPGRRDQKGKKVKLFFVEVSEAEIVRQRAIAQRLRRSAWWKRKLAKETCSYCNKKVPAKQLTMDHVVPIIRGGKSTKYNLVTACKECNNKKKYLLPIEWAEYLDNLKGQED